MQRPQRIETKTITDAMYCVPKNKRNMEPMNELTQPFRRICNPTKESISICNANKE